MDDAEFAALVEIMDTDASGFVDFEEFRKARGSGRREQGVPYPACGGQVFTRAWRPALTCIIVDS